MQETFDLNGNLFICNCSLPVNNWDFTPAAANSIECENENKQERLCLILSIRGNATMPLTKNVLAKSWVGQLNNSESHGKYTYDNKERLINIVKKMILPSNNKPHLLLVSGSCNICNLLLKWYSPNVLITSLSIL